jgi:hypothetical protein
MPGIRRTQHPRPIRDRALRAGIYALTIGIALAFAGCAPKPPATPVAERSNSTAINPSARAAVFDSLITRELIAEFWSPAPAFKFASTIPTAPAQAIKHFTAELEFARQNEQQHYIVDVALAEAGHYLQANTFQQRKDSDIQRDAAAIADYPAIGARAKREFLGAGPGGAAYGLTFTTTDQRFDVRITVSNLLPENITAPTFDVDGLAQRLSQSYDAQQ